MHEVLMPKMGETMEKGTIEKWLKKEGDYVKKGDVLYELATDKVSLEVESFYEGYLRKIIKGEGEEVPIMEVIAYIGDKDEPLPEDKFATNLQENLQEEKVLEQETQTKEELKEEKNKEEQAQPAETEHVSISPLARKIAEDHGLDISGIKGSGPGGRIVKEDVEKLILQKQPTETQRIFISPFAKKVATDLGIDYKSLNIKGSGPNGRIISKDIINLSKTVTPSKEKEQVTALPPSEIKILSSTPLKGMRKVIAQKMTESNQNIPHILSYMVCDVTKLIALREGLKERIEKKYNVKITYTDFLTKISASAISEFIEINSSLQDGNHIIYEDINIGIATSVNDGLIVPTIFNADKKGILEIAKNRAELVEKGKDGKLSLEEISNGTFTISNLGMYGVRSFTAIINPPQAAILMVSEMYESPVAINGKVEIKTLMEVGVGVDHRIIDGALAAKFLARVKEYIENPELLIL